MLADRVNRWIARYRAEGRAEGEARREAEDWAEGRAEGLICTIVDLVETGDRAIIHLQNMVEQRLISPEQAEAAIQSWR